MTVKVIRIALRTMKWVFIVLLVFPAVFLGTLFFREQKIPPSAVDWAFRSVAPSNLTLRVESVSVGFKSGIRIRGLRLYDREQADPLTIVAGADAITVFPLARHIEIVEARYPRLPDSYYAPGNLEKNAPVLCTLPALGTFTIELTGGDILGIRPKRLIGDVTVTPTRFSAENLILDWPDKDETMSVRGFCSVDFERQEIVGEVSGTAKQANIRPMMVNLDIPSAMPYYDGFTEVPGPVPSGCSWKVNLVNNDFDLWLDLKPTLGRYNGVPMKRADGKIHLHVYTRGTWLNYRQTIGPIHGVGIADQPLDGTIVVSGTNGYNTVDVEAKSALPVADLLRIGGFTGDYVGKGVFGDSSCRLQFRFPRAMTNNYEVLDGFGHIEIKNGQLMRMKGFAGLIEAMPKIAPAITWISDSTQASADYTIEKGVIRSDNVLIEGKLFSIRMYGAFDAVANRLDFTVRVQFARSDSFIGKVLHPLTWPFTKLILEFRLSGTPENPKWSYISVVDRVLEVVK